VLTARHFVTGEISIAARLRICRHSSTLSLAIA